MEVIYYNWSTSSWGTHSGPQTERKEWARPTAASRRTLRIQTKNTQLERTPTFVQSEKRTHTSDTRESLRLDGIISGSISVSRTIEIASRSGTGLRIWSSLSHSIHSWLWIWMDLEQRAFFPQHTSLREHLGTRAVDVRTRRKVVSHVGTKVQWEQPLVPVYIVVADMVIKL